MRSLSKTISRSSIIFLSIGLLLFARVDQTAALARGNRLSDGFTARISTSDPQYLRGEPVVFKLGLSHQTQSASVWQGGLLYVSTKTTVIATNSSGQEFRWEGEHFILSAVIQNSAASMANRDIEFKLPLDLDTVHRIFPQPGAYNVKVAYTYYPDAMSGVPAELVSDPVRVNIQEPTGINRMAYDYYQTSVKPVLSSRIERDVLDARREFSRRFGESVYAKYNSFELARLYERAGDFQLAEDELYPISDVDFFYRDYIDQALNRLGGKLGRPTVRSKRPRVAIPYPAPVPIFRPDLVPIRMPPAPAPVPVPYPYPTVTPRPV